MTLNKEQENLLNQIFEELKEYEGYKNEIEEEVLNEYIYRHESNLTKSEDDIDDVDETMGIDIWAFGLVEGVLEDYMEDLDANNLKYIVRHGPEQEIRAPYDRDILISFDYSMIEFYFKEGDEYYDEDEAVYIINVNVDIYELKKEWIWDYFFISEEITSVFVE